MRAGPADDSGGCAHGECDPTTPLAIPPESPSFRAKSHIAWVLRSERGACEAIADRTPAARAWVRVFVVAAIAAARRGCGSRAALVERARRDGGLHARRPGRGQRVARAAGRRAGQPAPRVARADQLAVDATLSDAAVWKARHMAQYQYFAHDDPAPPVARTAYSRKLQCGYSSTPRWGENIAGPEPPSDVMNSWINSPGHRANLENLVPGDRRRRRGRRRRPHLLGAGLRQRRGSSPASPPPPPPAPPPPPPARRRRRPSSAAPGPASAARDSARLRRRRRGPGSAAVSPPAPIVRRRPAAPTESIAAGGAASPVARVGGPHHPQGGQAR